MSSEEVSPVSGPLLTDVSQVDQAVLADVGAGAGLRRDDGAAGLFVADDAQLRRPDATGQVHVEDGAEFLQQLRQTGDVCQQVTTSGSVSLRTSVFTVPWICIEVKGQTSSENMNKKVEKTRERATDGGENEKGGREESRPETSRTSHGSALGP